MTEPLKLGRYSKVMREMQGNAHALARVAERLLIEKDAEITALTEQRDRYRSALEVIAGSEDRLQALQAACALENIGPKIDAS